MIEILSIRPSTRTEGRSSGWAGRSFQGFPPSEPLVHGPVGSEHCPPWRRLSRRITSWGVISVVSEVRNFSCATWCDTFEDLVEETFSLFAHELELARHPVPNGIKNQKVVWDCIKCLAMLGSTQ